VEDIVPAEDRGRVGFKRYAADEQGFRYVAWVGHHS